MSQKLKIQGRKLKNLSDPSQAHSHKAGATVHYALTAVDPKWGRYLYIQYRRYHLILKTAAIHYEKAIETLNKCRQLPVEKKSGFREVPDDLKEQLEINTMQFLILLKLGIEYLITEYEPSIKHIKTHKKESFNMPQNNEDISGRLKALADVIGTTLQLPPQLATIVDRRHIIEHPTTDRLWNGTDTGWKTVNLSWALSGDIEDVWSPLVAYLNDFMEKAEKYITANPVPGELKISHRGLVAGEQYKKPNTES